MSDSCKPWVLQWFRCAIIKINITCGFHIYVEILYMIFLYFQHMLSLHLYWGASIWSCIPNPKAWSNSVSTKRQHWAGGSRSRSFGCLHVKYGRWTNQGTLAWKGGGSPSRIPPPKFNSKIPWKPWWLERKTLSPFLLGWVSVTFQGRFLLNFRGGGVDVCKNQLMELMVSW